MITIPAERVAGALEECADAGVKSAVIFSSGFAESGGASVQRQKRIGDIAATRGILVCGPNSVGILNEGAGVNASFTPSANIAKTGVAGAEKGRGVAVISQSGGLGFAIYNRGARRNIRFSYVVSTGNEAHLGALDFADHLLCKDEVGVLVLLLEEMRGASRFLGLADQAASVGKPLIVVKLGRSNAARRSALSHTGAMTGAEFAYDAVFRHAGVIRAEDQDELLDIAAAFASGPLPAGRNVGIVTISGGVGVWLADACERHGLAVPELDDHIQNDLRAFIPDYGGVSNPVDILTYLAKDRLDLPATQVIGLGTQLDTIRFRSLIAQHLQIPPTQMSALILGEHGESMVPIWSSATFAGLPLEQHPGWTPNLANDLFARTRGSGSEVISKKGGAGFAVGIAIRDVIESIALDKNQVLPVSSVQDGCYGIRDVSLSVPTVVGRCGVVDRLEVDLWPKEVQGIRNSGNVLRQTLSDVLGRVASAV